MLKVSRRTGEAIRIDENIRVVVLDIRGELVTLGISAPKDILVLREELLFRVSKRLAEKTGPALTPELNEP
ncbi:carbon storage regulator [Pseudomonas citronellolis]|uniref:carbon storage regulator n=1 Tax=Pseudomonas citronellolis TaxID=53408 RepID=UPI00248DB537|nr:carbon storage regulator [Pseudomonas citronellolis]